MFKKRTLFDQDTFYDQFTKDLRHARNEVIIESPFITQKRMQYLLPLISRVRKRGVRVIINTRNPIEHDGDYQRQAQIAVDNLQDIGVTVLYTAGHHRKLAVVDRSIIYEGSLNILSYSDSCEIMRKMVSNELATELCEFINIDRYILEKK